MVTRERNYIKQELITDSIITESKYLDDIIRKKYITNLIQTVQAGLSGLNDDMKKVDET